VERFFITFLAAFGMSLYFSRGKASASVERNDFNTNLMGRAVRGNDICGRGAGSMKCIQKVVAF
jgi:hypothetical protein